MERLEKDSRDLYLLSIAELDTARLAAIEHNDHHTLEAIQAEAREREDFGDPDGNYRHLVEQCEKDIKFATGYYG